MSRPFQRDLVYAAIDAEREYQDSLPFTRAERVPGNESGPIQHSVGDFVTMLQQYQANLVAAWTNNPGDDEALHVMRKIAGIAVNCMEQHGAPHRIERF